MKYGVLGDGVNLASRLEELNKRYNTKILMSDATFEAHRVQDLFTLRQLDQVAVKGKQEGTKIYECLGRETDTTEDEKLLVRKMSQSFRLYYERKFAEAEVSFQSVQRLFQEIRGYEDSAAKLLSERCARYVKSGPGKEWNGTDVLAQKHF
jgi:adenylate cyclase